MTALATLANPKFLEKAVTKVAPRNPRVRKHLEYLRQGVGLLTFKPRPDDMDAPGCPDQQASFVNSKDEVAFCIGGNGAGTSVAAALKTARFLLMEQPPPRKNTPFWVMSNTFENTCNVCWGEKLDGMGFIPECEVADVAYHNRMRNQPKAVVLKPWPKDRGGHEDRNWVIEFKTFEQGRSALQGASLGGFWISETPPALLCGEAVRGLRDYHFLGARMIEFTPLDPWLSMEMEQAIETHARITHGEPWKVYRANTMCNLHNLPGGQDWVDSMLAFTPEELWPTRLYGDFAVFENQIYAGFSEAIHMLDCDSDAGIEMDDRVLHDRSLIHAMGTDWGWTSEHAHCTVWATYDPADDTWFVYDEYWTVSQTKILRDHVDETLDRCERWGWPIRGGDNGHRHIDLACVPGYRMNHADSAAPGNIREFCKFGVPTSGYSKTNNSVLEGIYYLKHLVATQEQTGQPKLKISSRCKHLLNEMRMYKWKRGQTNMMALNPGLAQPIPLPRYDHACFPAGVLIETPCDLVPIETLRPGDLVMSHLNHCVVEAAYWTGHRDIYELLLEDGQTLQCTAEHPIALTEGGFAEAIECLGKMVDCRSFIPGLQEEADVESLCSMEDSSGTDTPMTQRTQTGTTFVATLDELERHGVSGFIGKYGTTTSGESQKAAISTTRTETRETIYRRILKRYQSQNTEPSTEYRKRHEKRQPNGMAVKKGKRGIPSTERGLGSAAATNRKRVPSAALNTRLATSEESPSIAPTTASLPQDEIVGLTMSGVSACTAEPTSQSTVTRRRNTARENVQGVRVVALRRVSREPVFNLATSDGTFFANGVLVSNCDALRYLVMGQRVMEGWVAPETADRAHRIAGRNAELAVRRVSAMPRPSGGARSLVRFER